MQIFDYTHNSYNNRIYFVPNGEYSNTQDTDKCFSTLKHKNYNLFKTQIITIEFLKFGFCTKNTLFCHITQKILH